MKINQINKLILQPFIFYNSHYIDLLNKNEFITNTL